MLKPKKLNKGNGKYITVVAPSSPIVGDNVSELLISAEKMESLGYNVAFSDNLFAHDWDFVNNPAKRAEDVNKAFADPDCQMVWCAKGGNDCMSLFEYLDFDLISKNPKIFCGFSDITSLNNVISEKCGFVTFSGTNFKTFFEEDYMKSLDLALDRFEKDDKLFLENANFEVLRHGKAQGKIIGGNLSLMTYLSAGKYVIDFKDKILFLEELGFESSPKDVNRNINYMLQNKVFENISGLVIGNYVVPGEEDIKLEDIILKNLELSGILDKKTFPIMKTNCFGHINEMTPIPIGVEGVIDTKIQDKDKKLMLTENTLE